MGCLIQIGHSYTSY